jgi:hypothetical protein
MERFRSGIRRFEVASVKRNTVDEFPDFTPRRSGDRITMHSVRLASVVMPFARDGNLSVATSAPNLITAIEEELGLKLKGSKGPVEVLVVDHVDKPSEN